MTATASKTETGTGTADAVTEMRTTNMTTLRRDQRLLSITVTGMSTSIIGRTGLGSDYPWLLGEKLW